MERPCWDIPRVQKKLRGPVLCCVAALNDEAGHTAQPGTSLHPPRGQLLDGTELQLLVLVQKALFS